MKPLLFLHRRPLVIAVALHAGLAAFCTQVPLLNYLGYESSALTAFFSSCIAGGLAISAVRAALRGPEESSGARILGATRALAESAAAAMALLLIPLVALTVNALVVPNCSLAEGLGFFALLPVVSGLFGTALGFYCAAHYRHPRAMFLLICVACVGYSVALGYFTPAVFSYNFLYGYFPGLTYDEVLPLSNPLILFRLLTLLVSAVLVWMGMILITDSRPEDSATKKGLTLVAGLVGPGRRIRTGGIVLALAGFYFFRCELGFESTAGYIRQTLGGEYRTEHAVIYYAPGSFAPDDLRRAGNEHEFCLQQVMAAFSLSRGIVVESYIYPSAEVKQRLIGAGNTDIAKPWTGQIHLSRQSFEGSLKHELVHVAAATFGMPVIRANLSAGLVEGLATAVDGEWGNRTLHEYAAALRRYRAGTDLRSVMSLWGFAVEQSSVSYVLAGSFCRYLIDRYGIRKMMQLYRSSDYAAIYARSYDQLATEWQNYLDRVPVDDADEDCVDALFRRPTIFGKVCARVVARRTAQARAAFMRKEYAKAESLYARAYEDGRGYAALAGRFGSALRLGKYTVLTEAMDSIVLTDERPARYLPLFVGIGDAYWASGNAEKAFLLYDRVYHADLSETQTEAAAIRILALRDDPEGRQILPFMLTEMGDTARLAVLDSLAGIEGRSRVLPYLRAKALDRLAKDSVASEVLKNIRLMGVDAQLEAFRLRLLGQVLFRLGEYDNARAAFWNSLNAVGTNAARERVNTWIDRCEWALAHGF